MSKWEELGSEIGKLVKRKLDARGIGEAELREIANSRTFKRSSGGASGGGSAPDCEKGTYYDELLGKKEILNSPASVLSGCPEHSCPQNFNGDGCVNLGIFCSYACQTIQGSGFTPPQALICDVVQPGQPFDCDGSNPFDCTYQFMCDPPNYFNCKHRYTVHDLDCDSHDAVECHSTGNFACTVFNCLSGGLPFHGFHCDASEWFSCFLTFQCSAPPSVSFDCTPNSMFFCEAQNACQLEFNCDTTFFICDRSQGNFDCHHQGFAVCYGGTLFICQIPQVY